VRLEGWARDLWLVDGRHVWIVISQIGNAYARFRPIEARAQPTVGILRRRAESIDLEAGYAYLKVSDLTMSLTPLEATLIWLGNPALYTAAVVQTLREQRLIGDNEALLLQALAAAGQQAAATPWIAKALRFPEWEAGRWGEEIDREELEKWRALQAEESPETLVRELSAEELPRFAELIAVRLVFLLARAPGPGLSRLLVHLRFPIVVSHRTAAGAEGTEVITYVQRASPSAPTARIYYFYLSTDHPGKEVDLASYWLNSGLEQTRVEASLAVQQYAWIDVKLKRYFGDQRWFFDSKTGPLPIDNTLDAALKAMLSKAYADAVTAGITPTPCSFPGGFTLP
jgi:hypothetical protein